MDTVKPEPKTLSELQSVLLDIYKEIRVVLERHKLRYFAIGGTCIGAVRHGGFIPWDDDMDIAMPEPDYHLFIKYAREELPDHLGVFERREHVHDPIDAARVHNKNTTFIQTHELYYPDEFKGIFVDILPLCGVPEEKRAQREYRRRFCRYFRLNEKRRCSFGYLTRARSKLLWIAALPFRLLPNDYWFKRLDELKARYPYDEMKLTGDTWVAHFERVTFSKDIYEAWIELPFEDTFVRCSAKYDEYLRAVFGDYMTLPPENERGAAQNATIVLIDAKRPYEYYKNMYLTTGDLKKE